ncbi:hypothetical protein HA402_005654 [Bradysia odoriphaga]|nr:hypothetical protein HA402_005654 [Bradysia odoriphaga]
MSANFWNIEEGYHSSVEIDSQTYPYRIFGSGAQDGIYVQMHLLKKHLEYMCRGAVQGFKISLHTPGEIPQMSKHYFRVPLLQELWIYFKENQFITSKRSELFGPTDFLASCGGLLGLFMGASFLSIVELLYFLSLRLWCNLRSRMRRKQKNKIADSAVPVIVKINGDDKKE